MSGTLPATSFLVSGVGQTLGARSGFSVSGVALALCCLLGWRGLRE